MECCICGGPVEAWPGRNDKGEPYGYGNNPAPFGTNPEDRCCNWCNEHRVIPERLRLAGLIKS